MCLRPWEGSFPPKEGETTLPKIPRALPADMIEQIADESLMLRAGQGDVDAFEELVRRHQHAVVGTAAKMLGGAADAEDIAQTVFLRAWKSAPRYRPEARFTTWLMTITRNLVFNESRRRARARLDSLDMRDDTSDDASQRQIPDASQRSADAAVADRELTQAVDRAIASLPEKPRMALILRRYEDMPYEEIAKVLDISLPAVKSLLFRARTLLREQLADYLC